MVADIISIDIQKLGFTQPYSLTTKERNKVRALARFRLKSGIYLIKENDQIVYVGMSKNCVLKACYRHFEKWENRTTYDPQNPYRYYSILIFPISSHQVEGFERALICCLHPRDNKNKFSFIGEKELEPVEEDELPF